MPDEGSIEQTRGGAFNVQTCLATNQHKNPEFEMISGTILHYETLEKLGEPRLHIRSVPARAPSLKLWSVSDRSEAEGYSARRRAGGAADLSAVTPPNTCGAEND